MGFKNRIVMIGYGGGVQAVLPMLVKHPRVSCAKIMVIDFVDRTAVVERWIEKGLRFVHHCVTPFSLARLAPLSRHRVYFEERAESLVDKSDPWQFRNFIFRP